MISNDRDAMGRYKTSFRCALDSVNTIRKCGRGLTKGPDVYRLFQFIDRSSMQYLQHVVELSCVKGNIYHEKPAARHDLMTPVRLLHHRRAAEQCHGSNRTTPPRTYLLSCILSNLPGGRLTIDDR